MTERAHNGAGADPLSRTFYDIALALESAEDSEARVLRVLDLLRALVPYDRCAVLEAIDGAAPRLYTAADASASERAELAQTITSILGRFAEDHDQVEVPRSTPGMHLAVPLIGLDEVVGVLFVRGAEGAYDERHLSNLSVVAAKLAAYFSMLRAVALGAERTLQLEEARRSAENANRAKDEFLALVSHELRAPLNTILAWADALRSTDTQEADRTRAFEAIERSVRAQAKLIEDLLDLSCVAAATMRLDLRSVEPAKLIEAAIRSLRPHAERKSIRLEATLDETMTPLLADPHRLSQVVANLIANAIKFTPDGGRVDVHLERVGARARIRVVDSGTGIGPEVLPNLFERFRQADSSSTRAYGGLGVGLALVKDLVELHGGNVRAESPGANLGATFTVELPLPMATPEPTTLARADQRALIGVRVLLVDDDRDICEVLQFVLEGEGALVTVALSAAEALAELERSMPDVLISDIAMPGGTGHDLMREIVARKGDMAPPAASLTAYSATQGLDQSLASGFRMQLAKPIEAGVLISAVAGLAASASRTGRRSAGQG